MFDLMKTIIPYFSLTLLSLSIKDISFGIITGMGLQEKLAKINVLLNFILLFLMIYFLCFHFNMPATGPWIALSLISGIMFLYIYRIICVSDVDQLIHESEDRIKKVK